MAAILSGTGWTVGVMIICWVLAGFGNASLGELDFGSVPGVFAAVGAVLLISLGIAFLAWALGVLFGTGLMVLVFPDAVRARPRFWPLAGAVLAPVAMMALTLMDFPIAVLPFGMGLALGGGASPELFPGWGPEALTLLTLPVYAAMGWRAGARLRRAGPAKDGPDPTSGPVG